MTPRTSRSALHGTDTVADLEAQLKEAKVRLAWLIADIAVIACGFVCSMVYLIAGDVEYGLMVLAVTYVFGNERRMCLIERAIKEDEGGA